MDGTYSSSVRDNETAGLRAQPWQFAYREALSPYILKRVLVVVGLYLGTYIAICPLGANHLSSIQRLAIVAIASSLCAPLCYAEYVLMLYFTRRWSPCWITMAVAGTTLLAAATCTAIAFGIDTHFGTELPSYGLPKVYLFMTLSVVLCNIVIHCLVTQRVKNASAGSGRDEVPAPASPEAPDSSAAVLLEAGLAPAGSTSKFLDRLPVAAGRDIVYLKMSDHYVEVVTTVERCNVLMRFADAVAELGDYGIRVHRSYWVAHRHMDSWARRNQRTLLRLTGDHVVPVSRTYLGAVRNALARHPVDADATGGPPTSP